MVFVGAGALSTEEYWPAVGQSLEQLTNLLESQQITASPVTIVGELSVDTVKKAHAQLEGHHTVGKLVMLVN